MTEINCTPAQLKVFIVKGYGNAVVCVAQHKFHAMQMANGKLDGGVRCVEEVDTTSEGVVDAIEDRYW